MTATAATNQRALPRYPLPFAPSSSSSSTAASDVSPPHADPAGHCPNPSPVEYKLSKISSASAEAAAVRMAQQAAALEELRRMKENKEKELKVANESALQRLLHGLSESTD
ncbi:hypothetical protein BGZ75_009179 [Mortierella antarctica]|nr:hypothetical protein BGZ67_008872 [Mortierella alpina]KAF9979827.1 hypothetical protein BGZ75_009179 [Mortierella antarctica]